ncbi:MAG: oligosaccharyl transferase, archaeosortase A system-associated [Dehalococcoidales bacterium]
MKIGKHTALITIGILLAGFFVVSLSFRIFLPYHQVFVGSWIKFTSNDSYYHMYLVDNITHNFPHLTKFSPFLIYPTGVGVGGVYFFQWLLAIICMIFGLGSPTQHTIDVIAAYYPVILAALCIIPAYFIGKALFNRWAGVIAAGLVAVLPGEFMGRSILGFTDQHVAETLFSTIGIMFVILALKEAGKQQLTFKNIIARDWKAVRRPLIYSLLGGLFLGIYLITWEGGLLFIFILSLYLVIQFIINHLRHLPTDHLGIIGFFTVLIALIIFWPFSGDTSYSLPVVVAMLVPPVLAVISWLMSSKGLKAYYYPAALIGIGVIFLVLFWAVDSSTFHILWDRFRFVFAPGGSTAATTQEMQPFLSPSGSFSTAVAWGNFTTSFFLVPGWPIPGFALISFVILIVLYIKQRSRDEHRLLFLVWSLIIFIATLVQRRFAYYLVINIALLSAYISWQVIWYAGLRRIAARQEQVLAPARKGIILEPAAASAKPGATKPAAAAVPAKKAVPKPAQAAAAKKVPVKAEKKQKRKLSEGITIYHINTALAIVLVIVLVFVFNIVKAKQVAAQAPYAPSDAWQASLDWMKDNTPDPFGDSGAYYDLYTNTAPGGFTYPATAYGVTSWWDYGYWITRIAHRLPTTNPSQPPVPIQKTANLFLSSDETTIQSLLKELGTAYVVSDYYMVTSKFWAIINWAGQSQNDYTAVYYIMNNNQLQPIQVYTPEYYQCLLVRLYNFNGQAVTDVSPLVITYVDKTDGQGHAYQQITDAEQASSYQAALDYIKNHPSDKTRIIGVNPFISPVPLDAVPDFNVAFSSSQIIQYSDNTTVPEVKIFQYTANAAGVK